MLRLLSGKKLVMVLIVLAALAAVLWWQRTPLLTWYYLRGLARSDDSERTLWVQRVAGLDAEVVPGLIGHLKHGDAKVCANAKAALAALVNRWGPQDARTAAVASDITGAFSTLGMPGREAVLEWFVAVLQQIDPTNPASRPVKESAGTLLLHASRLGEKGIQLRTLALAEVMLARVHPEKTHLYRALALDGTAAKDIDLRVHAARLAMHAPLDVDTEVVNRIVLLLKDTAAEVRCAALLAVGNSKENVSVDDLLPLLHDADAQVRSLCDDALKARGLSAIQRKLARLISDPRPGERLQIVHLLQDADVQDPGVWLQHLSQDASPAVRAAAVRFAAEDPASADFRERLQQMAAGDPSPTVQQLARYYLTTLPPN
jgi:hypothetical protein